MLRDARFRLLLAGETINSIGGWASAIVLWGFAAYRFGASPQQVSLTIVCWAAPPALLGPLAGVCVDRLGPARAVIAGYLAAAAAALGMAAAGSLTVLDLAAVGYGMARALAGPAAGALPPRVVGDDDLLAANALLGAAASAGQVAGPLAASVALALSGFPAAFVLDAVSYLIGAAVVVPLRLRPLPDRERAEQPGWKHELATGVRLVVAQSGLRRVLLLSAAVTFTAYAGAFAWGVAGALFGAVSVTSLQRLAPARAHGRVMGVSATLQSWVEAIGLPLGGVTLAGLGIRAGALALAAVAVAAGMIGWLNRRVTWSP